MTDDSDMSISERGPLGSIETTVRLEWSGLGEHFMRASSVDQALFLRGWDAEADLLGYHPEDLQYAHIPQSIPDDARQSLADRLRRLAEFLEADQ